MIPLNHGTAACIILTAIILSPNVILSETFQPSINVYKDISLYSNISVTGECTSCNRTCPYREQFPDAFDVLANKGDNCSNVVVSDLPSAVNSKAGNVTFNSKNDCQPVTSSVNPGALDSYSVSFWIQATCKTTCQILRYGTITVSLLDTSLQESTPTGGVKEISGTFSSQWTHIVMRYDGTHTSWFVNGVFALETALGKQTTDLILGPEPNLEAGESVSIADARFYDDVLTNREVKALRDGQQTLEALDVETNCRCPPEAPIIKDNSVVWCTDQAGTLDVRRLNVDGGYLFYINDGDEASCWTSRDNFNTAKVFIDLQNVFQMAGLSVFGLDSNTEKLLVWLEYEGQVTKELTFQTNSCGSIANCHQLTEVNRTEFVLDDTISVRQDVTALLADTVILTMSAATNTQFTICEINLHVRCHCWGNDPSCVVSNTDYTCNCSGNTTGANCQTCVSEFYRQPDEFSCMHSCDCNPDGMVNNVCEQDGGQCNCKPNVNQSSGRTCDDCKFNTVNLGSDIVNGCEACDCNPLGIHDCASNKTCVCKNKTETDTGRCESCLPDHFGLELPGGCRPCDCHEPGTTAGLLDQCNATTGACDCKTNVIGRQCDTCRDGFYNLRTDSLTGCEDRCECSFVGSLTPDTCDIITGNCACLDGQQYNRQCLPEISGIDPLYGPLAGGTIVTVTGLLLGNQSTSTLTFYIDIVDQDIVFWNSTLITVKTKPANAVNASSLSLAWTQAELTRRSDSVMFEYKDNPLLQTAQSFVSYKSGGCKLRVKGNHMNSTSIPQIVVHIDSEDIVEDCQPVSDVEMLCPTPDLSQYNASGNTSFGFMFDGYRSFEVLDDSTGSLVLVNDPNITGYTDYFGNTFTKEIEIKGVRLNKACNGEVKVLVGDTECEITSIAEDIIVCDPKDSFPGKNKDERLVVEFGYLRLEPGTISFKDFWNTQPFLYIAVGVGCFVIIVIVIIVLCRVRHRRSRPRSEATKFDLMERRHSESPERLTGVVNPIPIITTPTYDQTDGNSQEVVQAFLERLRADVRETLKSSIVEISNIKPGKVCTLKGDQMRVINGTFSSHSGRPGDSLTIKTNITPYSESGELPSWLEKGLLESTRMRDFVHENVLASCGLSVDTKHVYVLYPEMSNRTLKDHLTLASQPFTEEKRLDISVQVAEGMNFLDSHHMVHKDLAARNCWVNSEGILKVADASFTKDLYPDEYLTKNDLSLPVRWMAPESLRQIGFYHSKSDVWSFGVLMWEVFTNGFMPYYDITNSADIKEFVCNQHYHLGKPHGCSNNIFSVIQLCLSEQSEERPNFFLITNHLTEIISPQSPVSYVNEDGLQDDIYQNTNMAAQNSNMAAPPLPPKSRRK